MQAGDLDMVAGDFDDGGIDEAEIERILENLGKPKPAAPIEFVKSTGVDAVGFSPSLRLQVPDNAVPLERGDSVVLPIPDPVPEPARQPCSYFSAPRR